MKALQNHVFLFTAHIQQAPRIEQFTTELSSQYLHLPLELHKEYIDEIAISELISSIRQFSNIFYDSLMHAEAFVYMIDKQGYKAKKSVQNLLNITKDKAAATYLEKNEIPAILASPNGKSIEAIELLIRLKRLHPTIYPSVLGYYEEFPALMHELGAACTEMPVIEFKGPSKAELQDYKASIETNKPQVIFFHAPNAVVRTQAAFPGLDLSKTINIAKDDRTAQKLKENYFPIYALGKGSWHIEDYTELIKS